MTTTTYKAHQISVVRYRQWITTTSDSWSWRWIGRVGDCQGNFLRGTLDYATKAEAIAAAEKIIDGQINQTTSK